MGMFDSVMFKCPRGCSELLELQSKAGDCFLARYDQEEVPLLIAADILRSGRYVYCNECGHSYRAAAAPPPPDTMPLVLV